MCAVQEAIRKKRKYFFFNIEKSAESLHLVKSI
jgi:hypothetical protein